MNKKKIGKAPRRGNLRAEQVPEQSLNGRRESKSAASPKASDDRVVDKLVEKIRQPLLDLAEERRHANAPLDGRERELFGRVAQDLYDDDEDCYHSRNPAKNASLVKISNRLWQAGLDYKPWTVRRRLIAYFVGKRLNSAAVAPGQESEWNNSVLVELGRLRDYPEDQLDVARSAAKKGLSKGRTKDAVDAKLAQLAGDDDDAESTLPSKVRWTTAVIDEVVEDVVGYLRAQLEGAPPTAIKHVIAGLESHLRDFGGAE